MNTNGLNDQNRAYQNIPSQPVNNINPNPQPVAYANQVPNKAYPNQMASQTYQQIMPQTQVQPGQVVNTNNINQAILPTTSQQITSSPAQPGAISSINIQPLSNNTPQKTAEQSQPLPQAKEKKDETEKKNTKLKPFKFVVINAMNKKEKGTFDAEDIEEVRSYLESQDYKVLEIKPRGAGDIELTKPHLSAEDLSFTLTQLSTYIKAGIPLVDSVRILAKQSSKPAHKKIWGQVVYELLHGENFSNAMSKQGSTFPALLVNMVKTAEMTGDLPSILDDMAEYYTSMNTTHKQMKSAMTYPIVILTLCLGVLIFMLVYLVPQFSSMFEANDAKLPQITLTVLGVSDFVKNYWLWLLLGIGAFVGAFIYLYKNVVSFKTFIQTVLMRIPVVSNIIIYNEIANFTKTFASLINHGVFITDSMEILSKITNNEIYKKIINQTMTNLQKGDTVSAAFRGQWAIPVVAYEMIVTGENTGQLGLMMEKVARHFQDMHKAVIDQMKSLMEPMMMIVLAGIVAVILLSIVTPMFSMYEQIR